MDYKKLAQDAKKECPQNCADCEYSEGIEFKCTLGELCSKAITELLEQVEVAENKIRLLDHYLDILAQSNADFAGGMIVAEKERDAAVRQLHGKCSSCIHYSKYHKKRKCENCKWDNANPACLREYQDDNWEWKGVDDDE